MRQARRMSSAAGLTMLTLLSMLLITPGAAAASVPGSSPALTPVGPHAAPMALATTGLDITVPVIIGIVLLVLGIAFVAWAFLRTGSAEQRH